MPGRAHQCPSMPFAGQRFKGNLTGIGGDMESKEKLMALAKTGKLLTQDDVLSLWPISLRQLSRLTNHRNEGLRLPSYRFGKKPLYAPEELLWYREKMRYVPQRKGKTI